MGLLNNVIRTAVISVLGAKLAKGRSPIVAALLMLLVSKAMSTRREEKVSTGVGPAPSSEGGLGSLIEKFRQGGLEDLIKSWIGTGPNKQIAANQLQHALGRDTVAQLERETGMPRDDLLTQLSRLLPDVIDKLTPDGKLPKESDLLGESNDNEKAIREMQHAVDKVIEEKKKEPIGTKQAEEAVAASLNEAARRDTGKA
jgi:uncharacterized protein YidB (DUF937 family)